MGCCVNLSQLRYFCKLAELQHYTRAAEELYITQPTLSNSIKQLESELGVPLFEHEGRNIRLTKWGREFQICIVEGLNVIDKGIAIAQEHADKLTGSIEIGTVFTIQGDYLPSLLRAYSDKFGHNVDVRVYQGLTHMLIDNLESGAYDLVFAAYVEHKPNLTFLPVLSQRLVVLVRSDSPLANKSEISLSELSGLPFITYREEAPIGRKVQQLLSEKGLRAERFVDDEISLGSAIGAEPSLLGLSLDTLGLSPFDYLVKIPIKDIPQAFHTVCLVYNKQAFKTRAVDNMIELIKNFQWDKCALDLISESQPRDDTTSLFD